MKKTFQAEGEQLTFFEVRGNLTLYFNGVKWLAPTTKTLYLLKQIMSVCPQILPAPKQITPGEDSFNLTPGTFVIAESNCLTEAARLCKRLNLAPASSPHQDKPGIRLSLQESLLKEVGPEGYRLEIQEDGVNLSAGSPAGLHYAGESLLQLIQTKCPTFAASIPCLSIEDSPRFAWRGMMLDVSRHFMPIAFIKKLLDLLAIHKMNTFHWHLTDDQGWRIEIKQYPKLTEVGAQRASTLIGHLRDRPQRYTGEPHGGYYTQDEIRDVVAYAAERHITIVPEIDMPGHMQAAIAAYPKLGNADEPLQPLSTWGVCKNILNVQPTTITFMQNVLEEVMDLFPGPYIHVGGDEAVKDQWVSCSRVQDRMRELGIPTEDELQSWFIDQMKISIEARGRTLIGWDEILEGGLVNGAAVMSWRGMDGGIQAAGLGHDVVMTPTSHTYFDFFQSENQGAEPLAIEGFTPLEKVYTFNPVPDELPVDKRAHILGSQCQLWTEYMPTPAHVEYMLFPRLCALAQVLWSPEQHEPYPEFIERLDLHLQRLSSLGINYRAPEELRPEIANSGN